MAQTTLFPTTAMPPCATACGVLYDVNGGCVPPAAPTADASVYQGCFCSNPKLTGFSAGVGGVCDGACQPDGLTSIRNWYTNFCANAAQAPQTTSTTGGSNSGGTTGGNNSGGGGGSWLSTHYQWVIFLVIMVIAIVGIWVGACIWRRRYLARKDRQYALGKNLARATESGRVVPNASQAGSIHVPGAGFFEPAPISSAGVYEGAEVEKARRREADGRRKWVVKERT